MNEESQGTNIIAIIIVGALIFGGFLLFMNWPRQSPPPKDFQGQPIDINIETPPPAPTPETQEPDLVPETNTP